MGLKKCFIKKIKIIGKRLRPFHNFVCRKLLLRFKHKYNKLYVCNQILSDHNNTIHTLQYTKYQKKFHSNKVKLYFENVYFLLA